MSQQKINAIVFSRDRAAQLKLFLDSVEKNAPDVFDLNVIIEHTSEEFDKAYGKVVHNPKYSHINFLGIESDFKDQVLGLMKTKHDYFSFFLDDDIIYDKVELEDITSQIESDEDVVCFSLRLGENVTKCYTLNADNVMHDIKYDGDFMKWDWSLHYLDFGYPFSVNGHIFRRKDIYKIVRKSKFVNVEEMEMNMFDFTETFPRNKMASYRQSRLVNVPIGRVQMSVENEMTMALKDAQARAARRKINDQFNDGECPSIDDIDFSEIIGCHQELDLGFKMEAGKGALDAIAAKKHGKLFDELSEEEQEDIKSTIDKVDEILKAKENEQD